MGSIIKLLTCLISQAVYFLDIREAEKSIATKI